MFVYQGKCHTPQEADINKYHAFFISKYETES